MRKPARRRKKKKGRLRRIALLVCWAWVAGSIGLVILLRWWEPPVSAVMLQRLVAQGPPLHQRWVDLADVDPQMALAVVAAEDQRFPSHWGFDTVEIAAALERRLEGGRLRGASTISQQVARNLFLWQGRSYLRKGLEAWFTGLIEILWPKRRILEMYLNFSETGERTFGVAAASERFFGVEPHRLGRHRAALVAAVLPNPVEYRIDAPSAYVIGRRQWILEQMRNLGGSGYLADVLAVP